MNHLPQTERLYFREFTLSDAALLYEMHQDPAITRYTGDPIPWDTIERVETILRDIILPQYKQKIGRWAVHLKSDHSFIGWCGLKNMNGEIDLGYRLIQEYWGNGYATEAAKAVLEYGIHQNLSAIIGRAAVANEASVAVLYKIGLSFVAYYQEEGKDSSIKLAWIPQS